MASPPPTPPLRILLSGDPLGRLHLLFKRVISVSKSTGPFDALFCVGQFFSTQTEEERDDKSEEERETLGELSDYIEGRATVPIPTYFTGGFGGGKAESKLLSDAIRKILSTGGFKNDGIEICPNLYWLRGSAKFSLKGLSVVYLSGGYTVDDVDALRALADEPGIIDFGVINGADTTEAPKQVLDPSGYDTVVSELVTELKPRYHIAGTKDVFYTREPYINEKASHVTRFIGLATVGNKQKQRFIHAISPTPASAMSPADISAKPSNTTPSPYKTLINPSKESSKESLKRTNEEESQYWRYDVSNKKRKQGAESEGKKLCFKYTSTGDCQRGQKCHFAHDDEARELCGRNVCFDFLNKGKCERGPDCKFKHSLDDDDGGKTVARNPRKPGRSCWFCLSSPDVETHLIASLGENYYLALAKGPLVENHMLVVPIEHCPNTLVMSSEAESELENYKNALVEYFGRKGEKVVFFEFAFQQGHHANLQVIPIPDSKAAHVEKIFNMASERLGFEFSQVNERNNLRSKFDGKASIFYVQLPGNKIMVHTIDENEKFPVQFGREVLAGLLGKAERADWRNCKLSKEEETEMVEKFKAGFSNFDPAN
ncbi:hypothetical protein LUZ60_013577 [Juncus effusus]|nr:hypothetical protein LUZ60_013577 [Juncus effusus]